MKLGIALILLSLCILFVVPGAIPETIALIIANRVAEAVGYGIVTIGANIAMLYYGVYRIKKHYAKKKARSG